MCLSHIIIPLRITVDDVEETLSLIPLSGVIISPQLELLDPSNSSCNLDKVAFGNVYYNTTVSRSVLLFNNSPVSSRYLAVIDSNAEGTVDGLNVNEGLAMVCTDGGHHLKPCSPQDSAIPGETLVQVIPMQVCQLFRYSIGM